MDKLRHDLREIFDRQQEGLGDLAGQRDRVLRVALERRDEPLGRRTQFLAGIVAAAIAVLVVATFAYVRIGTSTRTVTPPATSSTPGAPASVQLHRYDIDLVDGAKAWALLSNCDAYATDPCSYYVAVTIDSGQTWSKPVQVGPAYQPADGGAPRTIRFINANDGFVYGSSAAFVTHDGGKTWTSLDLHSTFYNVIAGRGLLVWAFTYPCAKGTSCSYEARSSRDGGRSWSTPKALPAGLSPFEAIMFGSSGVLVSGGASGPSAITADGGKTWRSINSPCKDPYSFLARVATSDGSELWELCMGYPKVPAGVGSVPPGKPTPPPGSPDSADKALFYSKDGGLSWSLNGTSQAGNALPAMGAQVSLLSTRSHELLLGTDRTPIVRTIDAGATWTQVRTSPSGGVQWLRFVDPQTGWALDTQRAIWTTTDGGTSWLPLGAFDYRAQRLRSVASSRGVSARLLHLSMTIHLD